MAERPGAPVPAVVRSRTVITEHLVRLRLAPRAGSWHSSGVPDEWVALTVPGQFQTRYYTVRAVEDGVLVVDVVVHDEGLVTHWVSGRSSASGGGDCVGDEVGLSAPKGSVSLPEDAQWMVLVGDLTGLPAIGRILETAPDGVRVTVHVEAPEGTGPAYTQLERGLDPSRGEVVWHRPPSGVPEVSGLADVVTGLSWPDGPGYFWMAGESAAMRAIRKHVRHEVGMPADRFDVMGYWSVSRGRRAVGATR